MRPSRPSRLSLACAAATVAGVLLVFAPAVVGLRTLSHRDTDRLYAPLRPLVVEALRDLRLPLWNPHEGTGKPLFAEGLHAVLHPVSLLGAALAPESVDALLLGYLVAAALGAFVLARGLGASPPAAAAAGLAFALSGYPVSMTGNLVFLAGLSTLPWVAAAARGAGAGAPWGVVATALAAGSAALAGDPQAALVGAGLGLALAADAGGLAGAGRALGGLLAGALLGAVQLAATWELLPHTFRSLELGDFDRTRWPLAPGRLLEWVLPGLFRGPLAEPNWAAGADSPGAVFAESVFLGAPVLLAAALGVWRTRRRAALVLAGAAGLLLWLALGHHLGARPLLDGVPVWGRFRYAEKLMAPLALCVAALGALGVDAFGAAPLRPGARWGLAAAAAAAGSALAALHLAPAATGALAAGLAGEGGPHYRAQLQAGLPHLVVALGALLAVDRLGRGRTLALALLVALAPAAAVSFGAHLGDPGARGPSPLRLAGDGPVPRVVHPVDATYDPRAERDHVDAVARLQWRLLNPAVNVASRVDTLEPYTGFEPRRLTEVSMAMGPAWVRGFRRFGLTHVVVGLPFPPPQGELAALATEGGALAQRGVGFEAWAVPHRPWAFFAERAVARALPPDAHRTLLELLEAGDDGTVVVEAAAAPPVAPGRVLAVERGTEEVRVEAEAGGPALLVLQDAWWPGWRATIDGQPAALLAADVLVRAVPWPAGRHRLELRYDPPAVRLGLWISAAGAALVALLAARAAWLSRRPVAGAPGTDGEAP